MKISDILSQGLFLIAIAGSLISLGGIIENNISNARWEKETVIHGCAEYKTENGKPIWEWKQ